MNVYRAPAVLLLGTSAVLVGSFFVGNGYAQGTETTAAATIPETAVQAPATAETKAEIDAVTKTDDTETDRGGLKDYLKRTFRLTGAVRVRVEGPQGSNFTLSPADAYAMTRIRLGLGYQPMKWFRVFAEAED